MAQTTWFTVVWAVVERHGPLLAPFLAVVDPHWPATALRWPLLAYVGCRGFSMACVGCRGACDGPMNLLSSNIYRYAISKKNR
jgi:drug/metabolite transporter (DMT)-like permease